MTEVLDPNELFAVPEEEQLDEDPGFDPEATAGEADPLKAVPEGSDEDVIYFTENDKGELIVEDGEE